MRAALLALSLLAPVTFLACTGGTSDDTGDDQSGGAPAFEDFVNVSTVYVGDAACYDGVAWNTQTAGAGCTSDIAVSGTVSDFQSDENVEGASVDFWSNDDINTSSSLSMETDSNGDGVATLPACTPIGYMTSTPPEWEETVNTYEVHQVYEWDPSGATSDTWNSVSVATSKLIPSLLGLEWTPGTSLIAGTAYDCGGEPIQHAQVFIHDADGNIPADIAIRYFDNGLPNSDQPDTNDDGLWSAVNIPPGDWIVEMWVYNGSELEMLGATHLTMVPDSVVISNIYTGIEDGVYLPASCLETCE
jgi:hypothetical protein